MNHHNSSEKKTLIYLSRYEYNHDLFTSCYKIMIDKYVKSNSIKISTDWGNKLISLNVSEEKFKPEGENSSAVILIAHRKMI